MTNSPLLACSMWWRLLIATTVCIRRQNCSSIFLDGPASPPNFVSLLVSLHLTPAAITTTVQACCSPGHQEASASVGSYETDALRAVGGQAGLEGMYTGDAPGTEATNKTISRATLPDGKARTRDHRA
ncbi:hypothetical protein CVT26_006918 [Gymnopilus dilepis]|uniref:Secreted protein n=1 Tax=Gymnopilus dilepis TaxID=231916 RepID=A0A409W6B4_9AGAR|nr:hypothetical protein CVT26_006918 [Gymnopilus dilepis]